jgi:NTE family protein
LIRIDRDLHSPPPRFGPGSQSYVRNESPFDLAHQSDYPLAVALEQHQVLVLTDRLMPVSSLDPGEKLANRSKISRKGNQTDVHPVRQYRFGALPGWRDTAPMLLRPMSAVGLVLGGGGITGAAYEMAALMAIEMATGWDSNQADVVIGTSSGSFVAALVRHGRLDLDSLVLPTDDRDQVAQRIRERIFNRKPGVRVRTWLRHGLLPGVRRPGLTLLLGSPAPYDTSGLGSWVAEELGEAATAWPVAPTVVVAYDVAGRRRAPFGTVDAPVVGIAEAVAASAAIPVLFRPWVIDGRHYVDGGVVSGTHADLVLGNPRELDLVLVIAPMAAEEDRRGAWAHERLFDKVGRRTLDEEIRLIKEVWPACDILVLRPTPQILTSMRPNPMEAELAVSTFVRTLTAMKRTLGEQSTWRLLSHHLGSSPRAPGRRVSS